MAMSSWDEEGVINIVNGKLKWGGKVANKQAGQQAGQEGGQEGTQEGTKHHAKIGVS